jgi:hypothetical protein
MGGLGLVGAADAEKRRGAVAGGVGWAVGAVAVGK